MRDSGPRLAVDRSSECASIGMVPAGRGGTERVACGMASGISRPFEKFSSGPRSLQNSCGTTIVKALRRTPLRPVGQAMGLARGSSNSRSSPSRSPFRESLSSRSRRLRGESADIVDNGPDSPRSEEIGEARRMERRSLVSAICWRSVKRRARPSCGLVCVDDNVRRRRQWAGKSRRRH